MFSKLSSIALVLCILSPVLAAPIANEANTIEMRAPVARPAKHPDYISTGKKGTKKRAPEAVHLDYIYTQEGDS